MNGIMNKENECKRIVKADERKSPIKRVSIDVVVRVRRNFKT